MKTTPVPWPAVRSEIAFQIAPEVYRLTDHRLAVHDPATGQVLVIEIDKVSPQKE